MNNKFPPKTTTNCNHLIELFENDIGGSMCPEIVIVKLRPSGRWKIEIDHVGNQTLYQKIRRKPDDL